MSATMSYGSSIPTETRTVAVGDARAHALRGIDPRCDALRGVQDLGEEVLDYLRREH